MSGKHHAQTCPHPSHSDRLADCSLRRRIPRSSDPADRAAGGRQRHRQYRAHSGGRVDQGARPARGRRRPAGRRAHPRARPGGEIGARWLHARHGADRRARHHAPHRQEAALRHRARLPADRADHARPSSARGFAQTAGQVDPGADRLCQGQSRQADQRLVEQRLARPCRRRIVQIHDRHQDRARALSRRRVGDPGPDGRPRRHHVREPAIDRAFRARRPGAPARRQRRHALAGVPGSADHRRGGARLSGADLDRRDRAGRRAASDRRQAQCRDQPGDQVGFVQGEVRQDRRRAGRRHAGRFRRHDPADSAKWGDVIKRAGIKF